MIRSIFVFLFIISCKSVIGQSENLKIDRIDSVSTTIRIINRWSSGFDFEELALNKNLELLELSGRCIDDLFVQELAHIMSRSGPDLYSGKYFPSLTTVVLDCTDVSDNGLRTLIGLLPGTRIVLSQNLAISELNEQHEFVPVIDTHSCNRVGDVLDSKHLQRATELGDGSGFEDFGEYRFPDGAAPLIRHLKSLRRATLQGRQFTDQELAYLAQCPLRHLALKKTNISGNGLNHIDLGLQSLFLFQVRTDFRFSSLNRFANLENLLVTGSALSDDDFRLILQLPNLKHLTITSTEISNSALEENKERLAELSTLSVSDFQLTPDLKAYFGKANVKLSVFSSNQGN